MADKVKILIIEDQTSVAMMMTYLLTRAGCEVQAAHTAEQGMRLAQDGDFDLITLNMVLPGISGFEICRRRKQNPHLCDTPVVLVSGHPCEEDQRRAFELGAVDYIIKPFNAMGFASRILSWVKPKQARHKFHPLNVSNEDMDADAKRLCNAP